MKLIECRVENFGILHSFNYNFNEGCNIINEENGFGKSTLAAFIRIMFYGFEGEGKKNPLENERKRYNPWQGGVYGGRLTFEAAGKTYSITRVFADKQANDKFELRDVATNLESKDFSENIGEELFGINSESYMRSVYIGQRDVNTHSTDAINAKIGGIIDGESDMECYQKALLTLDSIKNSESPRRKTGELYKLSEEIGYLKKEINDYSFAHDSLKTVSERIDEKKAEIVRLEQEKKDLAEKGAIVGKQKDREGNIKVYIKLKEELEDKSSRYNELKRKIPGDVPTLAELSDMTEKCNRLSVLEETLKQSSLTEKEEAEYARYKDLFRDGVPGTNDYDNLLSLCKKYRENELIYEKKCLSSEEEKELTSLHNIFGDSENPKEEIFSLLLKWDRRKEITGELERAEEEKRRLSEDRDAVKGKLSVWIFAGIILIAVSIVLFALSYDVLATLPSIPGILLVVLGILLTNKDKKKKAELLCRNILTLEKKIASLKEEEKGITEQAENYTVKAGLLFSESYFPTAMNELLLKYGSYASLKEKKGREKEGITEFDLGEARNTIESFLFKYGIETSDNYEKSILEVRRYADSYLNLKSILLKAKSVEEEANQLSEKVHDFILNLGIAPTKPYGNQVAFLQDSVLLIESAKEYYENALRAEEKFRLDNPDFDPFNLSLDEDLPAMEDITSRVEVLSDTIDAAKDTLAGLVSRAEELGEQLDLLNESKERLSELEEEYSRKKKHYDYALLARDFLTEAKETLTSRYLSPLLEGFSKYYSIIDREKSESYAFDANVNLTSYEQGMQRDIMYLSTGYQDLTSLCIRLSFADAMYKGEKPTLILDDPFVNLDENKASKVNLLLERLQIDYQILYFTCKKRD